MRPSRFRPIRASGGAQAVIAVGDRHNRRAGGCAILRLAIDDIGNVAAAQAEIGQGAVVEGAELGESALALAPGGVAASDAADEIAECRHDTTPCRWRGRNPAGMLRCTINRRFAARREGKACITAPPWLHGPRRPT